MTSAASRPGSSPTRARARSPSYREPDRGGWLELLDRSVGQLHYLKGEWLRRELGGERLRRDRAGRGLSGRALRGGARRGRPPGRDRRARAGGRRVLVLRLYPVE